MRRIINANCRPVLQGSECAQETMSSSPMCDFSEVVDQQEVNEFRLGFEAHRAMVDFICRDNVDGTRLLIHLRCYFYVKKIFQSYQEYRC